MGFSVERILPARCKMGMRRRKKQILLWRILAIARSKDRHRLKRKSREHLTKSYALTERMDAQGRR